MWGGWNRYGARCTLTHVQSRTHSSNQVQFTVKFEFNHTCATTIILVPSPPAPPSTTTTTPVLYSAYTYLVNGISKAHAACALDLINSTSIVHVDVIAQFKVKANLFPDSATDWCSRRILSVCLRPRRANSDWTTSHAGLTTRKPRYEGRVCAALSAVALLVMRTIMTLVTSREHEC
jgi:hypothetical protein